MYKQLFDLFLKSEDTLRIYNEHKLLFSSNKDRLEPLIEYIKNSGDRNSPVVVFDKIAGNAAALLMVKIGCREIYSPLGSQIAVKTFTKYKIRYHLLKAVPFIQRESMNDMCPMERLSIDKEPEEFYHLVLASFSN